MNNEHMLKKTLNELIELKTSLEIVLTKYDNQLNSYGASNFANQINNLPTQLRDAYTKRNEYRLIYDEIINSIEIKLNQIINEQ